MRNEPLHCPKCDYDWKCLEEAGIGFCPECGLAIDWSQKNSPDFLRPGTFWETAQPWQWPEAYISTCCQAALRPAKLMQRCSRKIVPRRMKQFVVISLVVGVALLLLITALEYAIFWSTFTLKLNLFGHSPPIGDPLGWSAATETLLSLGGPGTTVLAGRTTISKIVSQLIDLPRYHPGLLTTPVPWVPYLVIQAAAVLVYARRHVGHQARAAIRPLGYGTALIPVYLTVGTLGLLAVLGLALVIEDDDNMFISLSVALGYLWCLALAVHWSWLVYRWAKHYLLVERPLRVFWWALPCALTSYPLFLGWGEVMKRIV